jgi:hypothetical protein
VQSPSKPLIKANPPSFLSRGLIKRVKMGTLTADCPRLDTHCPHKLATSCRLTSTPNCCACADERVHSRTYRVYIDGVGFVQRGTRWQGYCWFCKGELAHIILPNKWVSDISHQSSGVTVSPLRTRPSRYRRHAYPRYQTRLSSWSDGGSFIRDIESRSLKMGPNNV